MRSTAALILACLASVWLGVLMTLGLAAPVIFGRLKDLGIDRPRTIGGEVFGSLLALAAWPGLALALLLAAATGATVLITHRQGFRHRAWAIAILAGLVLVAWLGGWLVLSSARAMQDTILVADPAAFDKVTADLPPTLAAQRVQFDHLHQLSSALIKGQMFALIALVLAILLPPRRAASTT